MSRGAGSSSRCGGGGGGAGGSGSEGASAGFARAVFGLGALPAVFTGAFGGFAPFTGDFAAGFAFCDLPFVFATRAP